MNERTLIDPKAFALEFAQTAYYLVDDFNAIERTNFKRVDEKKFQDLTFEELLNRVKSLNKY